MAHNDTHAARKKGGAGKILLVVLLLLFLAAGAAVRFAYNEIHGNGAPGSTEVTVSIPQGSGVATIANKLKEAGVIRSAYLFRWYVGERALPQSCSTAILSCKPVRFPTMRSLPLFPSTPRQKRCG